MNIDMRDLLTYSTAWVLSMLLMVCAFEGASMIYNLR